MSTQTASIHPFPLPDQGPNKAPGGGDKSRKAAVYLTRSELGIILDVYGRQVASGSWKDYSIEMGEGLSAATFSIFRRSSEAPLYRVIKDPSLARKQGMWRIVAMDGRIVKRGHDLKQLLKAIDRDD